ALLAKVKATSGETREKEELDIRFATTDGGVAGILESNDARYGQRAVARMAGHFTGLCKAIAAEPFAAIRELDFLGEDEKRQLLVDFNDTRVPHDDTLVHDLFVRQAALHGDKPAVILGGGQALLPVLSVAPEDRQECLS